MKKILTLFLFFLPLACSNSPVREVQATCDSIDWYEKGRQDGATGNHPRTDEYKKNCHNQFNTENQALYTNGYHAGLTDYCSPENAFQIGQMGGAAENHCPDLMKETFKKNHKKGAESRELKDRNQELAKRIQSLSKEVAREISSVNKNSLSSELELLKRQYAQNQKKLSRISN